MDKKPEALRLADGLSAVNTNNADSLLAQMVATSAAAELRRLHALNAELLEALRSAATYLDHLDADSKPYRAAIAKAEGKSCA